MKTIVYFVENKRALFLEQYIRILRTISVSRQGNFLISVYQWKAERAKMAVASSKTKVVLLSCGCFNPLTHMHLRMFGKYPILWYNECKL